MPRPVHHGQPLRSRLVVQRSRRWLSIALTTLVVLLPGAGSVFGWGRLAHRASARLAESRLSPGARAAVRSLLDPGESLADASTWADDVRRDRPETGPWHYVNVPLTETQYNDRFCPQEGCVVRKIEDYRKKLTDTSLSREERRDALRFLVHFVQDLHQPLHVGERSDRGGNDLQVQFFGRGSNLHRVWDSGILERAYQDESSLIRAIERQLDTAYVTRLARGTAEDWATESLHAATRAYSLPGTGQMMRKGAKLGDAYQSANLPLARERVAASAVRLALLINAALEPTVPAAQSGN